MVGWAEIIVIFAVGLLFFGGPAIIVIALIVRAVGRRKVDSQQFHELREDISQIKSSIEDLEEHIADITIRLG